MENKKEISYFPWKEACIFSFILYLLSFYFLWESETKIVVLNQKLTFWEQTSAKCLTGGNIFLQDEDGSITMIEVKSQSIDI